MRPCIYDQCTEPQRGLESIPDTDRSAFALRRARTCCDRHERSTRIHACRDCREPFYTRRASTRLVRCSACRAKRAASKPPRKRASKSPTLAERRHALECEADPSGAPMRRVAAWNLLRYAVGRTIQCPKCRGILDAPRAVHVELTNGSNLTLCADCWDERIGHNPSKPRSEVWKPLTVSVIDGRELCDPQTRMLAGMLS